MPAVTAPPPVAPKTMTRVTRTGVINVVAAAAAIVVVATDTGARALIGAERGET